jgi:MYXO-CTERM domain-containing protein
MRRLLLLSGLMGVSCALIPVTTAEAAPYFDLVNEGLGTTAQWTNYLRLADLDGDGDLDLVVPNCGGFFTTPPGAQALRIYENVGGTFTDQTASFVGTLPPLASRVVAIGDVDGDGDLDMYIPSAGGANDLFFINDGSGTFTDEASIRLPGGGLASRSAGARFGDVDGDGDLDLLIAQGYGTNVSDTPIAILLINDGTGHFTDGSAQIPATGSGIDPDDVDFIDFDRDFDLDVLINSHSGKSTLWRNDGSGNFSDATAQLAGPASNNYHYGPSVCDVDGDGDLDIWIDNIGGNFHEQLLINDGNGNFTDQTSSRVSGNVSSDDNGVYCVDVDNDGDFDAVIAALSGNERVLINDGNGNFVGSSGDPGFPFVSDPTLWMDFGDLNGDGRLDAVTGQGELSPQINQVYFGNSNNPIDSLPPKIIAQEAPPPMVGIDKSVPMRFAVSDRVVTDSGPRLERAFAKATYDGNVVEADARFMGGDLFRVVVPPVGDLGTVVAVELCAIDMQGNSACGAAQSYTVTEDGGVGGGGQGGAGVGGGVGGGGVGGAATTGTGGSSASDDDGDVEVDDGCGCRVAGGPAGALGWGLGLLGAGLWWSRRRRR